MKYIITDKNEIKIGPDYTFHHNLAKDFKGNVVSAGLCEKKEDGTFRVFGESFGFGISSKPEDANILNEHMGKL